MAERVTQEVVEVVYDPSGTAIRATQDVVEAVYSPSGTAVRVTQHVIEVVYTEGAAPSGGERFYTWWWD